MAENYRKNQDNLEFHRTALQTTYKNEFVPKEYYTEGLEKSDPGAAQPPKDENLKFFSFSTIKEMVQLALVLTSSVPLNALNWAAHYLFNEITVGSACYQLALIALPWGFANIPFFSLEVDYAILYSKELQFTSSQVDLISYRLE